MEGYTGGSNISTDSLLLARGVGGVGFGYGGYSGDFANPSANAIRLDRNDQMVQSEAHCTREIVQKGQDYNLHAFDSQNTAAGFTRVCDRISDAELRNGDRLRDIEREMNANAREAAKCCCEVKLQSCEDKAQIMAAIADAKATSLATEGRAVERALNAASAELVALRTQVACGCNCNSHHGHRG
jgi:hypothetical protein